MKKKTGRGRPKTKTTEGEILRYGTAWDKIVARMVILEQGVADLNTHDPFYNPAPLFRSHRLRGAKV